MFIIIVREERLPPRWLTAKLVVTGLEFENYTHDPILLINILFSATPETSYLIPLGILCENNLPCTISSVSKHAP